MFEQLIGRQSWNETNNIALGFTVRMDGDHYGSNADGNTKHQYGEGHSTQRLHVLMFGNVSVYTCHDTGCEYSSAADVPVDRWVWRSDHDSCWRDAVGDELFAVQRAVIDATSCHLPENHPEYLARVKSNRDAVIVKLADLRHNSDIRRLKGITEKDIKRMAKYHAMYKELEEHLHASH